MLLFQTSVRIEHILEVVASIIGLTSIKRDIGIHIDFFVCAGLEVSKYPGG